MSNEDNLLLLLLLLVDEESNDIFFLRPLDEMLFVELVLSLDVEVVFTVLLLVCNVNILVAGGDDCGNAGCCLFNSSWVDFLGIEYFSFLLLIDNDVDVIGIRLVAPLSCFDDCGAAMMLLLLIAMLSDDNDNDDDGLIEEMLLDDDNNGVKDGAEVALSLVEEEDDDEVRL